MSFQGLKVQITCKIDLSEVQDHYPHHIKTPSLTDLQEVLSKNTNVICTVELTKIPLSTWLELISLLEPTKRTKQTHLVIISGRSINQTNQHLDSIGILDDHDVWEFIDLVSKLK